MAAPRCQSPCSEGAPKLDISSGVDAFKNALLSAKSIVYADPAKGGASTVCILPGFSDRLGLAEQLRAKTILVPGGLRRPRSLPRGEAELGIAQASEIVPVTGARLVGPLPGEFASTTIYAAGTASGSQISPDGAKALLQFLYRAGYAAPILKAKGICAKIELGNLLKSRSGRSVCLLLWFAAKFPARV